MRSVRLLPALAALILALTPTGSAVAAPLPASPSPAPTQAPFTTESGSSEPVPIRVDGVEISELEVLPELPGPAAPGTSSGRLAGCAASDFRDVPAGHPFYPSVRWMVCENLTVGYRDGTFGVKMQLSRSETAIFLYRLSGERHAPGTTVDFRDVPVGDSAFTAVSWMKEKGYSTGYTDGTFGRNRDISRGELAAFLYRMSGQTYKTTAYSPYADMTPSTPFFAAASWLHSTGMITGYTDRSFRARRPVTRGEASKFIHSFDQVRNGTLPTSATNRWTTVLTPLHATTNPRTKPLRNLTPQTGTVWLGEQGPMTRVRAGTTVGWVNSDFLSRGGPGTTQKPYPSPSTYNHRAANNMAPWCWDIPMADTVDGSNAWAQYELSGYPEWPSTYEVAELIGFGHDLDPDSVPARAVQLHECAHILQYRAYRYDHLALDARMGRIYPNGRNDGVEHMADCMADAMGARRVFTSRGTTWTVGYGGTCTPAQMAAARKVIAGVRP